MKTRLTRGMLFLAAALLTLSSCALGEALSFTGTVSTMETHDIYADVGGVVESANTAAGRRVQQGDVLATLRKTKVYAAQAGTVTGIFAQPGDSAETVIENAGAVLYIEGTHKYTISASVSSAYDAAGNRFVRVGEAVFLRCYSDGAHKGTGVITAVDGTNYTVTVDTGEFVLGESVYVYRQETYKAADRIGKGSVARTAPIAVTGTGAIVSIAVKDGDSVARGDLLFETLEGTFEGMIASGNAIVADESGVIAAFNATRGASLAEGSVAATLYPDSAACVEIKINEYDLAQIKEGDEVTVELLWQQGAGAEYKGVVATISRVAEAQEEASEEVYYLAQVSFTPDESTRYGMSAVVTTLE